MMDRWFTVRQIDARTYAISELGHWEKVHSFLLLGDERAALIDTGLGIDSMKRITDQLTTLPIDVITTHVHTDHIGSHGEYERIFVHEAEAHWLRDGIVGLSIEQIRANIGRDITLPTPPHFCANTYTPFTGEPTACLTDGQLLQLGNRTLRILHTPGHSPGHICILDETTGYLFTGDLLYDDMPVYAFYPTTDPQQLVQSLHRLTTLPHVTKIFGSHHTLGLDVSLLEEVARAVTYLQQHDLAKFGTGVHTFCGFSVKF